MSDGKEKNGLAAVGDMLGQALGVPGQLLGGLGEVLTDSTVQGPHGPQISISRALDIGGVRSSAKKMREAEAKLADLRMQDLQMKVDAGLMSKEDMERQRAMAPALVAMALQAGVPKERAEALSNWDPSGETLLEVVNSRIARQHGQEISNQNTVFNKEIDTLFRKQNIGLGQQEHQANALGTARGQQAGEVEELTGPLPDLRIADENKAILGTSEAKTFQQLQEALAGRTATAIADVREQNAGVNFYRNQAAADKVNALSGPEAAAAAEKEGAVGRTKTDVEVEGIPRVRAAQRKENVKDIGAEARPKAEADALATRLTGIEDIQNKLDEIRILSGPRAAAKAEEIFTILDAEVQRAKELGEVDNDMRFDLAEKLFEELEPRKRAMLLRDYKQRTRIAARSERQLASDKRGDDLRFRQATVEAEERLKNFENFYETRRKQFTEDSLRGSKAATAGAVAGATEAAKFPFAEQRAINAAQRAETAEINREGRAGEKDATKRGTQYRADRAYMNTLLESGQFNGHPMVEAVRHWVKTAMEQGIPPDANDSIMRIALDKALPTFEVQAESLSDFTEPVTKRRLLQTQENAQRVMINTASILQGMDPNLQNTLGRWGISAADAIGGFIGSDKLPPNVRAKVQNFYTTMAMAETNFAEVRKFFTGVAGGEKELQFLRGLTINLSGDNPDSLDRIIAKSNVQMELAYRAMAGVEEALASGVSLEQLATSGQGAAIIRDAFNNAQFAAASNDLSFRKAFNPHHKLTPQDLSGMTESQKKLALDVRVQAGTLGGGRAR